MPTLGVKMPVNNREARDSFAANYSDSTVIISGVSMLLKKPKVKVRVHCGTNTHARKYVAMVSVTTL